MQIDGDRLNISLGLKGAEINELKEFVAPRLEYIDEIGFEKEDEDFAASSALIAFLISLKKTKPTIRIDMFNGKEYYNKTYGKLNWICHE